jgi:hypothetical protein
VVTSFHRFQAGLQQVITQELELCQRFLPIHKGTICIK